MKLFDLEAAKRGEPICTRDGKTVKFIAHVPEAAISQRLVVLILDGLFSYHENGLCSQTEGVEKLHDLFMAPKKRTVWVNLYPWDSTAFHYETKEQADLAASNKDRIGGKAWPLEIED